MFTLISSGLPHGVLLAGPLALVGCVADAQIFQAHMRQYFRVRRPRGRRTIFMRFVQWDPLQLLVIEF
jgi:hypothetical protein